MTTHRTNDPMTAHETNDPNAADMASSPTASMTLVARGDVTASAEEQDSESWEAYNEQGFRKQFLPTEKLDTVVKALRGNHGSGRRRTVLGRNDDVHKLFKVGEMTADEQSHACGCIDPSEVPLFSFTWKGEDKDGTEKLFVLIRQDKTGKITFMCSYEDSRKLLASRLPQVLLEHYKTASSNQKNKIARAVADSIMASGFDDLGTSAEFLLPLLPDEVLAEYFNLPTTNDPPKLIAEDTKLPASHQLQQNFEELQSRFEALQLSNEDLQRRNNNLQRRNNNLQRSNDNLQRSNENLQSRNEELQSETEFSEWRLMTETTARSRRLQEANNVMGDQIYRLERRLGAVNGLLAEQESKTRMQEKRFVSHLLHNSLSKLQLLEEHNFDENARSTQELRDFRLPLFLAVHRAYELLDEVDAIPHSECKQWIRNAWGAYGEATRLLCETAPSLGLKVQQKVKQYDPTSDTDDDDSTQETDDEDARSNESSYQVADDDLEYSYESEDEES